MVSSVEAKFSQYPRFSKLLISILSLFVFNSLYKTLQFCYFCTCRGNSNTGKASEVGALRLCKAAFKLGISAQRNLAFPSAV